MLQKMPINDFVAKYDFNAKCNVYVLQLKRKTYCNECLLNDFVAKDNISVLQLQIVHAAVNASQMILFLTY